MTQLRLVSATANPDKVIEIQKILAGLVDLVPRPAAVPDVVEDGDTFLDNARLKAAAIVAATGEAAVADDTGLEVDALDGRPGVHSARYANLETDDPDQRAEYGDNVTRLLAELADVADADRGAQFRTVVVVQWPDGREVSVEGIVRGTIARSPRGTGGFGYDPVFVPDDLDGQTFAEVSLDTKNAISHRGRAFRSLLEALEAHQPD